VFAAAMRRRSRAAISSRAIDRLIEELAARHANLGVTSGRQAVEEAAEPLETRGIVVAERGRFRVRERTVLQVLRADDRAPARHHRPDPLMLDSASKTFFHLIAQSRDPQDARLALRDAQAVELRAPLHRRRDRRGGDRRGARRRGARHERHAGPARRERHQPGRRDAATRAYLGVVDAIIASGIGRNISVKLTQLGLDVDKASAVDNFRKILERAEPAGFFTRIDMENSPYTALTLEIFDTLWRHGYRQIGVVLQSALYRSEQDLQMVNALGARVRLVKGAYKEPKAVAYQKKADVDAAYARMLTTLITEGHHPAIATHDPVMIELARSVARDHHIAPERFEFQMLYGVRRDLQAMLVTAGYRVRVYIPFGREWFPYFMRRLGERPANVGFAIRGILGERG
jgi:proline dehydrogenase